VRSALPSRSPQQSISRTSVDQFRFVDPSVKP
jgi:hypothetical protein